MDKISKETIYSALRSERLPEEIRQETSGMSLREIKELPEQEYCKLVEAIYTKELIRMKCEICGTNDVKDNSSWMCSECEEKLVECNKKKRERDKMMIRDWYKVTFNCSEMHEHCGIGYYELTPSELYDESFEKGLCSLCYQPIIEDATQEEADEFFNTI